MSLKDITVEEKFNLIEVLDEFDNCLIKVGHYIEDMTTNEKRLIEEILEDGNTIKISADNGASNLIYNLNKIELLTSQDDPEFPIKFYSKFEITGI